MSFSAQCKTELCKLPLTKDCCRRSFCYGALLFGHRCSLEEISVLTEHQRFGRFLTETVAETYGVLMELQTKLTRKQSGSSHVVSVVGEEDRKRLLHQFHREQAQLTLDTTLLRHRRCCTVAFLRGVFLSCGTVIDPEKEYHLEFTTAEPALAEGLLQLLQHQKWVKLTPALIERKGTFVVYLKGREEIADLLTFLGAQNSTLTLLQVMMLKDVRNSANRISNCEIANLTKTANAAAAQTMAILRIDHFLGLDTLSDSLRELAQLRLDNPELSLRELGEALHPPISRSGVNHRMQRILALSETLPELP